MSLSVLYTFLSLSVALRHPDDPLKHVIKMRISMKIKLGYFYKWEIISRTLLFIIKCYMTKKFNLLATFFSGRLVHIWVWVFGAGGRHMWDSVKINYSMCSCKWRYMSSSATVQLIELVFQQSHSPVDLVIYLQLCSDVILSRVPQLF